MVVERPQRMDVTAATLQGATNRFAVHEKDAPDAAVHQRHARHYIRLVGEVQVQAAAQVGVLRQRWVVYVCKEYNIRPKERKCENEIQKDVYLFGLQLPLLQYIAS